MTQVRERPQTPHGRQGRKPKKDLQWLASMYLAAEHEMTRIRCRWRHIVREKRAHNFPESGTPADFRCCCLSGSMIPMLGARVREVMGGRRRRSASRISALGAGWKGGGASGGLFVRRMRDGCSGPVLLSLHHRHDGDL